MQAQAHMRAHTHPFAHIDAHSVLNIHLDTVHLTHPSLPILSAQRPKWKEKKHELDPVVI